MTDAAVANDEFTAFRNDVLVEKFERFRNILLDGLSYRSELPLRTPQIASGGQVLDVGCGWGDTDGPVTIGSTVEQAIVFQLELGPAGEIFREAGAEAQGQRGEIENALRAELARYQQDGKVAMQSGSWTIAARKAV